MRLIDADEASTLLNKKASGIDDAGLRNILFAIAVFMQSRPEVNIMGAETSIYTEEELYPDCTVQVWKDDAGEVSVGWWENV